jgi:hypothetical protein
MEVLIHMMTVVVIGGFINGFSMGARSDDLVYVSHQIFVDDSLIFCGTIPDYFRYLRCVLLCFELASRLKINLAKSKLVPVGNVSNASGLAHILGCRVSSLPMIYVLAGCFIQGELY